jgi:hypothetical protein
VTENRNRLDRNAAAQQSPRPHHAAEQGRHRLCDVCNLNKKDMDWLEFLYRYATSLGIGPNENQKPWQQWMLNRAQNGLGTCVASTGA